ncbi:MAG: Wzz/FepE/Etk N-terminal domain-containing protein [Venatoribacter sp.]
MSNPEQQKYNDEIDLFDLIDDIKSQWKWLIGTSVIFTLVAFTYALLAKPVYQAELVLKPTTETHLLQLNQTRLKEVLDLVSKDEKEPAREYITVDKAFADARARVLSASSMRDFYQKLLQENNPKILELLFDPDISEEQNQTKFYERFSRVDPTNKQTDVFLRLKFELMDKELSAELLNRFVLFVLQSQREDEHHAFDFRFQAQLNDWKSQVEEMRANYQSEKMRRLLELQEASAIATSIKQQNPIYTNERFSIGSEPPLYMMGKKALDAEIEQLKQRSQNNEDVYVENLPELLAKIERIERIKIDWNKVQFAQLDQKATVPLAPIKPKKLLVLAIGVGLGVMIGAFLALISAAWKRRKNTAGREL